MIEGEGEGRPAAKEGAKVLSVEDRQPMAPLVTLHFISRLKKRDWRERGGIENDLYYAKKKP